ncbi:hypothetical protein ACH5RR_008530 [Cinchona calisaya]|uniref:Uncharacterized protein n=1 Tax=Cinchona calisaya TaxID=153742 RepID=A0ABD3ADI6_9GENT
MSEMSGLDPTKGRAWDKIPRVTTTMVTATYVTKAGLVGTICDPRPSWPTLLGCFAHELMGLLSLAQAGEHQEDIPVIIILPSYSLDHQDDQERGKSQLLVQRLLLAARRGLEGFSWLGTWCRLGHGPSLFTPSRVFSELDAILAGSLVESPIVHGENMVRT